MVYHDVTENQMVQLITDAVMRELENGKKVPTGISVRHIHLERKHIDMLFGLDHRLVERKKLSQPGQFACEETLDLVGPRGTIAHVRVLGPERKHSQVEVASSDARVLGIAPPVRASGELEGTPGIMLRSPFGEVQLETGVIIADRHIHMTPEDAVRFAVKDGDMVQIKADGEKGGLMDHVRIRVSQEYALDFHIDTDDGNAFLIQPGQLVTIVSST